MLFLSISEFKTRTGAKVINIVTSPKTNKLFAQTDTTPVANYKVEQAIDLALPVNFMYETEEKFSEGCISNVKETNPPIAVL